MKKDNNNNNNTISSINRVTAKFANKFDVADSENKSYEKYLFTI